MQSPIRGAVEELWQAMGLPVPPDPLPSEMRFEVDDVPLTLGPAPDGLGAQMTAELGALPSDAYGAEDQIRRLLRLSLALSSFNPAVLQIPGLWPQDAAAALLRGEGPAHPVCATLRCGARPGEASAALQHLVQWAVYARDVLRPAAAPAPAPQAAPASPADYVIIQP